MSQTKLKKWWQVYANDDEKKFFVGKDGKSGLCRAVSSKGEEFQWRSTDALVRESGLTRKRVEEIVDKYHKAGIVVSHAKDGEKWGYWEKVGATPSDDTNLSRNDQQDRVDKAKGKTATTAPTKP